MYKRQELAEVITGIRRINSGQMEYQGKDIRRDSVKERFRAGISYISVSYTHLGAAARSIEAGDEVEVDFDSGIITNKTKGETYKGQSFPPFMQKIISAGGLVNYINGQ